MKPLDLSKSQVEGLLQQVIQVTLGELCDEVELAKCGVTTFLLGEGEELIGHVLRDDTRTSFTREGIETLAGTAALRAIALFTQREGLDSAAVMDYLQRQLGITIQGLIKSTLARYERTAADRQATSAVGECDDAAIEQAFYERVNALNAQRIALGEEMSGHFRPKVEALLAANDTQALNDLISAMPECPMRMVIAGMYANHMAAGAHLTEHKDCNAL